MIAVAGGGPAGLAFAIHARLAGLECVVFDKRRPPLDKACGEGVMPAGVAALSAMGVAPPRGFPFIGVRYVDGRRVAEGRFASGHGLGVRRTALVAAMRDRAAALGAELRDAVEVRGLEATRDEVALETSEGAVHARALVVADGLHSKLRGQAGIEAHPTRHRRFGVRRHFALAPWSPFVEVHWAAACEAYVTPVSPREVGVALLSHGRSARFDELLREVPALRERLQGARPTSVARGAGPMGQRVSRRGAGRVALLGDAAGYVDAITGEGLTLAFRCAAALAAVLARGEPLAAYERRYRELSRWYYASTRLLVWAARHPRVLHGFVGALARQPALFDRLL